MSNNEGFHTLIISARFTETFPVIIIIINIDIAATAMGATATGNLMLK